MKDILIERFDSNQCNEEGTSNGNRVNKLQGSMNNQQKTFIPFSQKQIKSEVKAYEALKEAKKVSYVNSYLYIDG